jgi:hypothetical protein
MKNSEFTKSEGLPGLKHALLTWIKWLYILAPRSNERDLSFSSVCSSFRLDFDPMVEIFSHSQSNGSSSFLLLCCLRFPSSEGFFDKIQRLWPLISSSRVVFLASARIAPPELEMIKVQRVSTLCSSRWFLTPCWHSRSPS